MSEISSRGKRMEFSPRLVPVSTPDTARGVVLVLHGGARKPGRPGVSPTRAGHREWAVFRLLNAQRGWQPGATPVDDARWALRELSARYDGVPVALVGHSLGGRAAVLTAGAPQVAVAVSLAGWFEPTDRVDAPAADLLFVHGDADRVASRGTALTVARSARARSVEFTTVPGGKHAMLRHGGAFVGPAAEFLRAHLTGAPAQTSGPRWSGRDVETGAGRVELHAPQAGQTNRTPGM
jgi:pimeloyl-ACP methyl ester carboxylesterase